jgi:hypothetical protein
VARGTAAPSIATGPAQGTLFYSLWTASLAERCRDKPAEGITKKGTTEQRKNPWENAVALRCGPVRSGYCV